MIWSTEHHPFTEDGDKMLNFVYAPQFYVQIRLPIRAQHHHRNNGRGMDVVGMRNKHGQVQDFNASNQQMIQMSLRNDLQGLRTVMAIKAQFDGQSVQRLVAESNTNTHTDGWLVAKVR